LLRLHAKAAGATAHASAVIAEFDEMIDKRSGETEPWNRTRVLKAVAVVIGLSLGLVPTALFLRKIHVSTVIICCLIMPTVLLALISIVRPNWIERMQRVVDRELERVGEGLERRPPTGLP